MSTPPGRRGSAPRHRRGSSDGGGGRRRSLERKPSVKAGVSLPLRPFSPREADKPTTLYFSDYFLQQQHEAQATEDPKAFVDRPLKRNPEDVMADFRKMVANGLLACKEDMKQFIDDNFAGLAHELIPELPKDWEPHPELLNRISHPRFRLWAKQLNDLWSSLHRRVSEEVKTDSSRFSLLYVEHPVVLPGGRFMELYYWDTWWIVKGLLLCDMHGTARGILHNFASLIHRYGFIPNGTRVYYLNRSQPPLFSEMVMSVTNAADAVGGEPLERVKEALDGWVHALDDEYAFWMSQRKVEVRTEGNGDGGSRRTHVLNRFDAPTVTAPRPESYGADIEVANEARASVDLPPVSRRENLGHKLYRNIAAGCESGWDFSSRWCEDSRRLCTIITPHLLPVDLNAYMLRMERNLAYLHGRLGEDDKAEAYRAAARRREAAIEALLWDEERAQWFDYDLERRCRRDGVFPSNFFPLWAGCLSVGRNAERTHRVVDALARSGLIGDAGVQTSLQETGLQWDAPNCWAPIQDILVEGLNATGAPRAAQLARGIAIRWLLSNYLGWKRSNCFEMHEKYHSALAGERGAGGEYLPQIGFGWTNGVVLCFLERYGGTSSAELARSFERLLGADPAWRPSVLGGPDLTPPHLQPLFRFGYFNVQDDEYMVGHGATVSPREPLDAHRGFAVPFHVSEAEVPTGQMHTPTPRRSGKLSVGAAAAPPGAAGTDFQHHPSHGPR